MGPYGARKVRKRDYGPVLCEKGENTGLWARAAEK
ncbi:hypothetical protein CRG98_048559, partial [Punica granatum]